jgi:hypothetical protein
MDRQLKKYGVVHDLVILGGIAHTWDPAPNLAWLLNHTRVRPARFSYVADTQRFAGRNGVYMTLDPAGNPNPWFNCVIAGQKVTLTSEGAPGLSVNCGEGGLGLIGDVTVLWNGKTVCQGPAKTIELTAPTGRPDGDRIL